MSAPVTVRVMRNFRLMHNISTQELAEAAGKSQQWISKLELGHVPATKHDKKVVSRAFLKIILRRKRENTLLAADYRERKNNLLEEDSEWICP